MPKLVENVRVTTLTINPKQIDWSTLKDKFRLYRYKAPPKKQFKEKIYYPRVHNWYKSVCDDPCYFNTGDEYIYVLYPPSTEVGPLQYEDSEIKPQRVDITDPQIFHALVKTFVSNYFYSHEKFVSNADFFLPVANLDTDFITVLKIRINQNWNNPNEFFFKDEAKFLRKLQDLNAKDLWIGKNYYGVTYDQSPNPVFKQLKLSKHRSVSYKQKKDGIYVTYSSQKNRPKVTYHSVKSLQDLRESRSYVLNKFFKGLLKYFNQVGLPFQHKELDLEQIETLTPQQMQRPQISIGDKSIYIVDDRMRPQIKPELEPENFARDFCTSIKELFLKTEDESEDELLDDKPPSFIVGDPSQLAPGSYVLRIQDNEKGDFEHKIKVDPLTKEEIIDELALFHGFGEDPLPKFYKAYPKLVVQTLNINDNTKIRNDQERRKKKSSPVKWGIEKYLNYEQPVHNNSFRHRLEVSLNQLVLKDIVMHPQNALVLLPKEQLRLITGKVFMFLESLMYFDGTKLVFMSVTGNSNQASKLIKDATGKDLKSDVLKPAMEWYNRYQFSEEDVEDEDEVAQTLKKGRFIVTEDYIWQIVDSPERILYPDEEIENRLENLEEVRPIKDFYPKFPLTGDEPFDEQQLREYEKFLEEYVTERYISYSELKDNYGHIRVEDEKGRKIKTGKGLYSILNIHRDTNFKKYLKDFLGLPLDNIRSQDVMSVYQGIWYEPQTRQYLVGSKDSRQLEQEKGFVLRKILVHGGNKDKDELFNILKTDFFPMLQVNFVRHKQYTVYPFPFNLIEIWEDNSQSCY